MNILVTVDDNYITPLIIMLESLFFHNKGEIKVYLFYSNVTKKNMSRLFSFIGRNHQEFIPILVDDDTFLKAPVFDYFTKEMYYRLLCSRLLPKKEERILYLDPDILIRGNIEEFYKSDFCGKQIIGIEDYAVKYMLPEKKAAIGFGKSDAYINSGVLLFDLEAMRERFDLSEMLAVIDKYKEVTSYPDQDAINIYFKGDIAYANRIYNYNTGYGSAKKMLFYILGMQREKTEPVIVHYMGQTKPWKAEYYGKYFFEYYHYYKKHISKKRRIIFCFKPVYVSKNIVKGVFKRCVKEMRHLWKRKV